MTTIDYYFSTSSPWTYLGSGRFIELAKKIGAKVGVHPVNYGVIFPQSGGLPLPKRAPQRQAYRLMELKRWRDYLGVPIVVEPKNFPAQTPLSALIIIAAREAGHDALALSHAVLSALWRDDRSIDDPAVLASLADDVGMDGAALVEAAPRFEERYTADSEAALKRGIFGAPSWVLEDGEVFWGQDRLELLRWRLGA